MEATNLRSNLILSYLLESEGWVTARQLAQKLNVSDKTVRKDIATLTDLLSNHQVPLLAERGKGYAIPAVNKPKAREILAKGGTESEPLPKDLLMVLLQLSEPEDVDVLSERLFVSRSTLENGLKHVKTELGESSSDLTFKRQKNTVWLEGTEKSKRTLIGYHMDNRFHNPMSYDLINYSSFFSYDQMAYVMEQAYEVMNKYEILVSDVGIIAITIHVMIAVDRVKHGFTLETGHLSQEEKTNADVELRAARELSGVLEEYFNVEINDFERESIAYGIFFRRFFRLGNSDHQEIQDHVDPKYLAVIRDILREIRDIYFLDLTHDNDLFAGLAYHLQSTVDRSGYRVNYANPIMEDIRSKYPFVFELAIHFRNKFLEMLGVAFTESETSYLAVHLGAAVERLKTVNGTQRLKAALVCHASPSNSRFLMAKIVSIFGNQLHLCGPYSIFDVDAIMEEKPALIISTTTAAMEWSQNIPVAHIKLIPDARDTKQLGRVIAEAGKRAVTCHTFVDFFSKDFFFPNLKAKNSADVINFMADRLLESGVVVSGFKESTFERETFSTTVLQNAIALPHPTGFYSTKTTIAVATLEQKIEWGGSKAQVIFMLAVKWGEQQFLKDFYELLVNLSDHEEYVERLLKITTFEDFVYFLNHLES